MKFESQLRLGILERKKDHFKALAKEETTRITKSKYFLLIPLFSAILIAAYFYQSKTAQAENTKSTIEFAAILDVFESQISNSLVERSSSNDLNSLADSIALTFTWLDAQDETKANQMINKLYEAHPENDMIRLLVANTTYQNGNSQDAMEMWSTLQNSTFKEIRDAVQLFLTAAESSQDEKNVPITVIKNLTQDKQFTYKEALDSLTE